MRQEECEYRSGVSARLTAGEARILRDELHTFRKLVEELRSSSESSAFVMLSEIRRTNELESVLAKARSGALFSVDQVIPTDQSQKL